MVKIKVLKSVDNKKLPEYQSVGAAGADIMADEDGIIKPHEVKLIKTGLFFEIPEGYEIQIRPRSGLALKNGVTLLNSPGTIDADYRGEVGVIMINHSPVDFQYKKGDRIAQMVLAKYERADFELVEKLNDTERGEGGFGSTKV